MSRNVVLLPILSTPIIVTHLLHLHHIFVRLCARFQVSRYHVLLVDVPERVHSRSSKKSFFFLLPLWQNKNLLPIVYSIMWLTAGRNEKRSVNAFKLLNFITLALQLLFTSHLPCSLVHPSPLHFTYWFCLFPPSCLFHSSF